MSKIFQRTIEDFACENCGQAVVGDGYTNHCPECLWSKHVDVYPGDRAGFCLGMMEPIEAQAVKGGCDIIHRCVDCKQLKRNKVQKMDSIAIVANLFSR